MKAFFFSLIVPIYNVEKYINKCIDSILSQEYLDYELILINDGSTDNSGIICDEYEKNNSKIKVIHKKNGGLSSARNEGLKYATGKYIWFIDSDDWILDKSLETLESNLINENLEMLGFYEIRFIEDKNNYLRYDYLEEINTTNNNKYLNLSKRFVPSTCFYVYNFEFIKKNNLFFNEKIVHEDEYFNLVCFSIVKKIRKINKELYCYRIRKNSIINSEVTFKKIISILEILELCRNLKNSNLNDFFIDNRIRTYISVFVMYLIKYNEKKVNNNLLKKCKKVISNQNIHNNDFKGIKFEKFIYNLNIHIYFYYKKMIHKTF